MNLNYIYYFSVLASTEHYTKAANILNISQPSLSHAIDEIEKELGCLLFEKDGRNIKLTKYGKTLNEYVKNGLSDLAEGQKQIEYLLSPDSGLIKLAFIYTLGYRFVPNILKNFHAIPKNNKINFTLKQGNTTDILNGLENDKYDLCFSSYQTNRKDLVFVPIQIEELVVVVYKDHPLAEKKEIDISELKDEYFIYYCKESGIRPLIDEVFEQVNVKPKILFEVEEDSAVLGLVNVKYGVAVMPNIEIIDDFNVKKLKIINKHSPRYIYMATTKNKFEAPAVRKFINFVSANYAIKK